MLVKPPLGVQLIPGHPMNRGLVGWWLMNEGTGGTIYDLRGNGNYGTLEGDTHWVSGQHGPCLSFDGGGDYVDVTSSSLLSLPQTFNFTLTFWFNAYNNQSDKAAFAFSGPTDDLVFYPNDSANGSGGTRVFWRDVGLAEDGSTTRHIETVFWSGLLLVVRDHAILLPILILVHLDQPVRTFPVSQTT